MALVPAEKRKQVLVAGGGPAGLEAARVASLRGHRVTLYEKEQKLGGQVNLGSVPPFMQEMGQLIKHLSARVQKAGVQVKLGKAVTPELIEEFKPDVVVVATGACPLVPESIPGIDRDTVVTAWQVLAGHKASTAGKVIIIGGGLTGCETADFLALPADNMAAAPTQVTLLEMREEIAMDSMAEPRHLLLERLREKRVEVIVRARVKEILDDGVVFERDGHEETLRGFEYVILAMGAKSVDSLSKAIEGKVPEVYVIGDATQPRRALDATAGGAEIGRRI